MHSGKSGCIRAKLVVFEQMGLISGNVVVLGQKWLYSKGSGCVRPNEVVFGQSSCIRAKVVVLG